MRNRSVTQDWVHNLTYMQQSVLLTGVRGPDNIEKYHDCKPLIRWYRRCILISAMDGRILDDPTTLGGGSFTSPSCSSEITTRGKRDWWHGAHEMSNVVDRYIQSLDVLPHHFQLHFMHGVEILGYKHPVTPTRMWWHNLYLRLVRDMHLYPESEAQMDERLGDKREGWLRHADKATVE